MYKNSYLPIEFTKTQRGRDMLIYGGYRFVENRQSTKNKFWRCSRYVKYGCRATVVTPKQPGQIAVRISGLAHSHGPDTKKEELRLSMGIEYADALAKSLFQNDSDELPDI